MHTHTHKHANTHTQANAQTKGARGREGGRPRDSRTIRCLAHAQGLQKIKNTHTRATAHTPASMPPRGEGRTGKGREQGQNRSRSSTLPMLRAPKKGTQHTQAHTHRGEAGRSTKHRGTTTRENDGGQANRSRKGEPKKGGHSRAELMHPSSE